MRTIDHVLYVDHSIQGSVRNFSCAVDLAAREHASLTAVAVLPRAGLRPSGLMPGAGVFREDRAHRWELRFEKLTAVAAERSLALETRLLEGDDPGAVLAEVERSAPDLLVTVARPPRIPWLRALHAGDRRLLRRCPCPVWLLDSHEGPGVGVVLAALDVRDGVDLDDQRAVLGMATSVAGHTGAELVVVHAWSLVGEPILTNPVSGVSRRRLRGLYATTRRERRRRIERLLAEETPPVDATLELEQGSAVSVIRRVARRDGADIVVMGCSGRDGWAAMVGLGNACEWIAGSVPGSLITVPVGRTASGARPITGARPVFGARPVSEARPVTGGLPITEAGPTPEARPTPAAEARWR